MSSSSNPSYYSPKPAPRQAFSPSSTMPLPRKPRTITKNTNNNTTTSFLLDETSSSFTSSSINKNDYDDDDNDETKMRVDYSFDKFQIDTFLSSSSTLLRHPRPPPPPLPKQPPPPLIHHHHHQHIKPKATSTPFNNAKRFSSLLLNNNSIETPLLIAHHDVTVTKFKRNKCLRELVISLMGKVFFHLKQMFVKFTGSSRNLKLSMSSCVLTLYISCIIFIALFQMQVHSFYTKQTSSSSSSITNGLMNETMNFCNGPLFSYQINNMLVMPFSLVLLAVFTCVKKKSINPFGKENRFFNAALYCLLANEIFRMLESNMFLSSNHNMNENDFDNLNGKRNETRLPNSGDFLRIGLGLEPESLKSSTRPATTTIKTTKWTTLNTNENMFAYDSQLMIMRYSKPRLPPRLNWKHFESLTTTTKASNTTRAKNNKAKDYHHHINNINNKTHLLYNSSNDANLTLFVAQSLNLTRQTQAKMATSLNKTLYESTLDLYENEHVQMLMKRLFETNISVGSLVLNKLKSVSLMCVDVLVIGMRYYPLMGVMERHKSFVCMMLASIYMWFDLIYNIALTGLCEGLRLNISFSLLKFLRRIFGGIDIISLLVTPSNDNDNDFNRLLFSPQRIIFSLIKSLPHFFCLSYVTVCLTCALMRALIVNVKHWRMKPEEKTMSLVYEYYSSSSNRAFNLIYTRKENTYLTNACRSRTKEQSFEERYIENLFKQQKPSKTTKNLFCHHNNDSFRFSTRIISTYTVCFTVLFYFTCLLSFYGSIFVDMLYLPPFYSRTLIASSFVTAFICGLQLILSMRSLKSHLIYLYKGSSFTSSLTSKSSTTPLINNFSNQKVATNNFNFAGILVTYTCWGYMVMFALVTFLLFQLVACIFLGGNLFGAFILICLVPLTLTILLFKCFNRCMNNWAARYCFLQSRGKHFLALKNTKAFHLFLYFRFFYDCFTGVAFCLVRTICTTLLGILYLPRLDYSCMGAGWERMDAAYMAYMGLLKWEATHTNPIMVGFCDILKRNLKMREKMKRKMALTMTLNMNVKRNTPKLNVIRNRWYLFYFMTKNKQLVQFRKK